MCIDLRDSRSLRMETDGISPSEFFRACLRIPLVPFVLKKCAFFLIVLVISLGVVLSSIHANAQESMQEDERVTRQMLLDALIEAIRIAEEYHYKPMEDRNEMFHGAIKGALASLNDPYTYYISKQEQQRARENLYTAQFGGLGIHIYAAPHGFLKISKPLANTPAARANLQAGDTITKVNGTPIRLTEKTGVTLLDVVDLLRGEIGTDVTITVQRKLMDPFDVVLTRAQILLESVTSTMLDGNIGYIRLTGFIGGLRADGTYLDFLKALDALKASGMRALIFDLRGNSGGLLNTAYRIADAFIGDGIIVSTKGRNGKFKDILRATPTLQCPPDIPLIVLVNEYSASASEIVAGAIQDTQRGILVGQKTYGKGVVQKRYPLLDGSALSLTISTYYTPNGTSIHEVGLTPQVIIDSEVPNEVEQLMLRKVDANDTLEIFVDKWIDDHTTRPGEMLKDFAQLEAEIPRLQQMLAKEGIFVSLRWLKERTERIFNRHVGIEPVVSLAYDRQLQGAIDILKTDSVSKYIQTPHK